MTSRVSPSADCRRNRVSPRLSHREPPGLHDPLARHQLDLPAGDIPVEQTGKRSDQSARLVEGRRVMGWREALNELGSAYPGRLR